MTEDGRGKFNKFSVVINLEAHESLEENDVEQLAWMLDKELNGWINKIEVAKKKK